MEASLREGLEESPWEQLKEQVVLGGEKFVEKLRQHLAGNAREQRGARPLAVARPTLSQVIASVETVKGESGGVSGSAWRQRARLGALCGMAGMRLETAGAGGCCGDDGLQHGIDCRQTV